MGVLAGSTPPACRRTGRGALDRDQAAALFTEALQAFAVEDADFAAVEVDDALVAEAVHDSREGFRLDRQVTGHQLLGHRDFHPAVLPRRVGGEGQQVAHHAVGGVLQGKRLDLVDALVQAGAELGQQGQGQRVLSCNWRR